MITFENGVRIFPRPTMTKDIYIGIANFGFENDISEVLGIAHLLEHILISFDYTRFIANASTSRSYMSFWCKSINDYDYLPAIVTAISWFFKNGQLRTNFSKTGIRNYIKELENEYYFRSEVFHCTDILTFLNGGDLYNGGRITMLEDIEKTKMLLAGRMMRLTGNDIVIFVRDLQPVVLHLLMDTFGTLPTHPSSIDIMPTRSIYNKVVMVPAPFYMLIVEIDNILENVLAVLCLSESYHFIDYETMGDRLYITLSFVYEHEYDSFIQHLDTLRFSDVNCTEMNYSDDYLMNIYINFPSIRHDIADYMYVLNNYRDKLLRHIEDNIRDSIRQRKVVAVYPSFSPSMFNTRDRQNHKLIVLDVDFSKVITRQHVSEKYIPRNITRVSNREEILINYNDPTMFDYIALAAVYRNTIDMKKSKHGIIFTHGFVHNDIQDIMSSETFIKYSRSRPAALMQYIFLAYFITGKNISEILEKRENLPALDPKRCTNKLIFPRRAKYDITTKYNFVCGVITGPKISNETVTALMWEMKRKGLIYSLDYTNINKNIFYFFTFSVYPKQVYKFISTTSMIKKHCCIVSTRGDVDDFTSLKKEVILTFV